jgi:replicative DNA helicase
MIQTQIINYLLATKDKNFLVSNNIDEKWFSDYPNEYKYIQEHIDNYGNIPDPETFLAKFPKFPITEVNETPEFLYREFLDDRNTRVLTDTLRELSPAIASGDIEGAIDIFKSKIDSFKTTVPVKSVDLFEDLSRLDMYLEKVQNFNKYYVTTGFRELDDLIGGWDRTEDYVTIVARTNTGKSWFLLYMALAAAKQGLRVGIYSGEMSTAKVGFRIDTFLSHISNSALIRGNASVLESYQKYLQTAKEKLHGGCIKVLTPSQINGTAGVKALETFIDRDNLDILFIDQHSLLEDDKHARTPHERAANISQGIKNLQVMKQMPIITVAQQNREKLEDANGKAQFDSSQVALSDRISQDSTILIFLESRVVEDNQFPILEMHLIKSRDSAKNKDLSYIADFDKGEFTYLDNCPETDVSKYQVMQNDPNESF